MPNRIKTYKPKGNTPTYDQWRGGSTARGYDYQWQQTRRRYLQANPLCIDCGRLANEVHHLIKKKEGGKDTDDNLASLCKSCHSARTAKGE